MSAAKRRVKRKIAMLVRLDSTHYLCQNLYRHTHKSMHMWKYNRSPGERSEKADRIAAAMNAAGKPMVRRGYFFKAVVAINAARKMRLRGVML